MLFVLESFRRHMDNGRWLFQLGMEAAGYVSAGGGLPAPGIDSVDVEAVVRQRNPPITIFWPRYEWSPQEWGGPEVRPEHEFRNWQYLLSRPDILRVCVLHDAASAREKQRRWHAEFQAHVYLTWYHERSVLPWNPHIRPEQLLRTYHVIDPAAAPPVRPRDGVCLISGARNPEVYPLRTLAIDAARRGELGPGVDVLDHPGYPQTGTRSTDYLAVLARYRVAVCTASVYGFALRKIVEATAVGCRVIANLPSCDGLPGIDENLCRIRRDTSIAELRAGIYREASRWQRRRQLLFAEIARRLYDYRAECARVAGELDQRRADKAHDMRTYFCVEEES